jgi:hypothetical protein
MSMAKHNSGDFYIKEAKKAGLQIYNGRGDHVKIVAPAGRGYMIIPMKRELSNGTEYAIRKWFKTLGIILSLIVAFIMIIVH